MSDCNGFFKECLHAWGREDRVYIATTQSQSLTEGLLSFPFQAWIERGLSTTCFNDRHSARIQGDKGNKTWFSPLLAVVVVLVTQLYTTLWPHGLSMGFSRQEHWDGLPFPSPGGSSWPRDQTQVCCIAGRILTIWAIGKSWFSPLGVPNIAGSTCMHTNAQTRITDFNIEGWPTCHENQRTELLSGGKVFMESWLWVRCFREGCKDN